MAHVNQSSLGSHSMSGFSYLSPDGRSASQHGSTTPAQSTSTGRPGRPHRRLSHPATPPNWRRIEHEDGEFIKRAFDKLSVGTSSSTIDNSNYVSKGLGGSVSEETGRHSRDHGLSARRARRTFDDDLLHLQNDEDMPTPGSGDPLNTSSKTTQHELPLRASLDVDASTYPSRSRASLASSTISQPFSSTSTYSDTSSRPLLREQPSSTNDLDTSPRSRPAASPSSLSAKGKAPAAESYQLQQFYPERQTGTPETRLPLNNGGNDGGNGNQRSLSVWSDPFAEPAEADARARLRRHSTISGYSISSADWNSLRRGSLASLGDTGDGSISMSRRSSFNPSPHQYYQNQRSRYGQHTSHANGNGEYGTYMQEIQHGRPGVGSSYRFPDTQHAAAGSGTATPTDASRYASLALGKEQPTSSLRWEAWASAYRESLLQAMNGNYAGYTRPFGRSHRYASISEEPEPTASTERSNPFVSLRRQFSARTGSRSEENRILVLELCHALEEYARVLHALWLAAHVRSSSMLLSTLVAQQPSTPDPAALPGAARWDARASREDASNGPGRESPTSISPTTATDPASSLRTTAAKLDKAHLELLASEVDSLVREVIEAVPSFSYALLQGIYGPLPFPINTDRTTAADVTIQAYFEHIHVVPSIAHIHQTYFPAQPALASQTVYDVEKEPPSTVSCWVHRLRKDLQDGLLVEVPDDSPILGMQSVTVTPSMSFAQDQIRAIAPPSFSSGHPDAAKHADPAGSTAPSDSTASREKQLLAEGRRRWLEYQQGCR